MHALRLDGAVLSSLAHDEWMALAQSSLLSASASLAEELWTRLQPCAALSKAMPSRVVDVLPLSSADPLKVVVCGGTGAGKSTLINALLGCTILPTSCMRACTAAVIEMAWPDAQCAATYEARVALCSAGEWREALIAACAAAVAAGRGKSPQVGTHRGAADWSRVTSFYGTASVEITAEALVETEASEALVETLMGRAAARGLGTQVVLRASDEVEFAQLVQPYVDSSDEAEGGALWPLVQRVTLLGPFSLLSCGLRLYDVPGTHDENAARERVMKSVIASAHTVLLTSNIRRACNDKSAKDLLPLALRRLLLERGWVGELAFVASQSDVFNRSELIDNLGLAEDASALDAALARNAFTKLELTKDFTKGVHLAARATTSGVGGLGGSAHWHRMPFKLPVFTVSAVEHSKLNKVGCSAAEDGAEVFTRPEETELPALLCFLRYAALAHHRRAAEAAEAAEAVEAAEAAEAVRATTTKCGGVGIPVIDKGSPKVPTVGDKVFVLSASGSSALFWASLGSSSCVSDHHACVGQEGVLLSVGIESGSAFPPYKVGFPDGKHWWFSKEELQLKQTSPQADRQLAGSAGAGASEHRRPIGATLLECISSSSQAGAANAADASGGGDGVGSSGLGGDQPAPAPAAPDWAPMASRFGTSNPIDRPIATRVCTFGTAPGTAPPASAGSSGSSGSSGTAPSASASNVSRASHKELVRAVSLRKAAGLMQKQLAAAVGMSDAMISCWINGKLPTGTEGNVDAKIAGYLASTAGAAAAAGAVAAAASAAQELKNLKRPAPALAAAPRKKAKATPKPEDVVIDLDSD